MLSAGETGIEVVCVIDEDKPDDVLPGGQSSQTWRRRKSLRARAGSTA